MLPHGVLRGFCVKFFLLLLYKKLNNIERMYVIHYRS